MSCLAELSMIVLLPRFQLYFVCHRDCFLPHFMFWEGCEVRDPFREWDTHLSNYNESLLNPNCMNQ